MSKKANRWEAPMGELLPYLQWSEVIGKRTDRWDTGRHNHATYEIHIIMDGECDLRVSSSEVSLQGGQGIMIAPGTFHAPNGVSPRFLRLSALFLPHSSLTGFLPAEGGFVVFDVTEPIHFFCNAIFDEINRTDSLLHKELLSSQFSQLMIHVLRAMGESQKPPREQQLDGKQIDEMVIIDRFFTVTPPKQRTKENLANLLHCSQRQVLRKVHTLYGISFQRKQTLSRLDTAQHLLQTTHKSIDEISQGVGYSDNAAFYRAFKLYTNMTPVQYRKHCGLQQEARRSGKGDI